MILTGSWNLETCLRVTSGIQNIMNSQQTMQMGQ